MNQDLETRFPHAGGFKRIFEIARDNGRFNGFTRLNPDLAQVSEGSLLHSP